MSRRKLIWASFIIFYLLLAIAAQKWEMRPAEAGNSLRWGGDATGGAPYIYEKSGRLVGFETDLAKYLAKRLDTQPSFVQGTWENLPRLLDRNSIDIVLNGYEWSAKRDEQWESTIPYYSYSLDLIVHTDNDAIKSWEDLGNPPEGTQYRVGVLSNSAAYRYLKRRFGEAVDVRDYSEGVTSAMELVQQHSLDATVQDHPAVVYYVTGDQAHFKKSLKVVEPQRVVGAGYYVIYVSKDRLELRDKLNDAIRQALRDGTLEKIYKKHGVWTANQQKGLEEAGNDWPPKASATESDDDEAEETDSESENWWTYGKLLLRAAATTVLLSCLSMPVAMGIGLLVACGRLYGPWTIAKLLGGYVELLRGTPLLMQLYVIFFVFPEIGIRLDAFVAGFIGLAINYSAYEAENYRAGLLAVPSGQMEAALALGMTRWTALRRIIVPQAVRIVIPPVTNDFIALFKDTSVCSVISVTELTKQYSMLTNDNPGLVLKAGALTAILYLLMSYPLSLIARRLERRFPKVVT